MGRFNALARVVDKNDVGMDGLKYIIYTKRRSKIWTKGAHYTMLTGLNRLANGCGYGASNQKREIGKVRDSRTGIQLSGKDG